MDDTIVQDSLKLEERNWSNWLAAAEKTRDRKLQELAATSAKNGVYCSGGRLKEDLEIIFAARDEVVAKAVALRRTLATRNPVLAEAGTLAPLISKIQNFINMGVSQMEEQMSKTFPEVGAVRKTILGLAGHEVATLVGRATNDLENIPLELRLKQKENESSPISIQVSGNSGIVDLGSVVGDLNNSVQALNESGQRDLADAIEKLGFAIRETKELH